MATTNVPVRLYIGGARGVVEIDIPLDLAELSPWSQPGGPGTPVEVNDPVAGVQSGAFNAASAETSTCLGGALNIASGGGATCIGGFLNTASGASAGCFASYICDATGTISACVASDDAVASGIGAGCYSVSGGTASGDWCAIVGANNATVSGRNAAAIGGDGGLAGGQNAVSIGGGQAPNPDDIALGKAASNFGVFGAACVPQQPGGGSGTAGPAYTANEQQMLQAIYSALVKYGLIA